MKDRLVIVDGVRTPFCKAGTDLAWLGADELGRIAVNALLARTGLDPALVDEVILGCVAQPVDAANVARWDGSVWSAMGNGLGVFDSTVTIGVGSLAV